MKNWKYIEGAKVGNYTPNYRYKGFLITNPEGYEYVVFLQDGIHVGYRGTTSKAQAEDWCDWHDPKTGKPVAKFRNSKTGNIAADITTDGNTWFVTTSDGKKKEFPSEREAEEYVKKIKTGNGVFSIFKSDKPIKMKSPQGAIVTINPDGTAAHQDKEGSQMAVHPHNSFKEAVEYYKSQGYVKVSNESLGEYMAKKPRVINEEKTGAEEFFKQLSNDVKEREDKDDAEIEKIGNANKEDTISHLYTDLYDIYKKMPSGTTPWAYLLELQKKGWDMNTISKYSKEIGKIVDRYKAGNAKTGNAFTSSDKKRLDELARKKPTQLTPQEWKEFQDLNKREEEASREMLKQIGNKVGNQSPQERLNQDLSIIKEKCREKGISLSFSELAKELEKYGWDFNELRKLKLPVSIGNAASDDKFAYVMREFDEGKLKTPDGKVVTDPAQAKAIAYSESKKTENGLARARNAMAKNKKVKNSAVREYKHSDGRVAQIDFNEDGSDADMSIYEGTKEIEQRNFSTIRDAEQYVISHGFRRI